MICHFLLIYSSNCFAIKLKRPAQTPDYDEHDDDHHDDDYDDDDDDDDDDDNSLFCKEVKKGPPKHLTLRHD